MNVLTLNRVYALYILLFVGVVSGILPRDVMLFAVIALAAWTARAPMTDAVNLFVRCIPLFVALPLTLSFDNFNMWRPLALLIVVRYLVEPKVRSSVISFIREFFRAPLRWCRHHPVAAVLSGLFLFAVASLGASSNPNIGVLRIIYFTNLSFVPFVLWGLVRQKRLSFESLLTSIALPTVLVVVAGAIQLIFTYFVDIYQFMGIWGEGVQLRQFGTAWSNIAVWMGNTWFAYYGDQLSLRIFSLFPDSHSFPTFVLLGIPALLAIGTRPLIRHAERSGVWALMRTKGSWAILTVPPAFLAAILSGTRGIWAASVGVVFLVLFWGAILRMRGVDIVRRRLFLYAAAYLAAFFLLFSIAWPIFTSPQFLVGKSDSGLISNRIKSVIDFGETSNAIRLQIWRQSIRSIAERPVLGVGIGNFPVVLGQSVSLARAGSTAHNIYLQVAAETGIVSMLLMFLLQVLSIIAAYRWFVRAKGPAIVYAGSLLLYLPWVYAYVLTDPILFDERVFLFWGTALALVWSHDDE